MKKNNIILTVCIVLISSVVAIEALTSLNNKSEDHQYINRHVLNFNNEDSVNLTFNCGNGVKMSFSVKVAHKETTQANLDRYNMAVESGELHDFLWEAFNTHLNLAAIKISFIDFYEDDMSIRVYKTAFKGILEDIPEWVTLYSNSPHESTKYIPI